MIIAFGHKKRNGKGTAARHLVNRYGFKELAFADTLKFIGKTICGFTDDQLNGTEEDKENPDAYWGFSPRWFNKTLATEVVRVIDQDFWIKALNLTLLEFRRQGYRRFVISDLRFLNEAKFIKNNGGICINITRPGQDLDAHQSETELDNYHYDITIRNDATIEALTGQLDIVCDTLLSVLE